MKHTQELLLNGKPFTFETGRFAKQADGAVMVRYADTMVLATVVGSQEPDLTRDYFPLQVEYREKTSAAGKIPGGFFKREGRPTEKEILAARLIDRPIRPMFPKDYRNETQVMVTVYSSDIQHDADVLGACAASAAIAISGIPFDGPIAEVRVGRIDGQFVINPTYDDLAKSDIDLIIAGTEDSIVMVEGESHEISEQDMIAALRAGHAAVADLCRAQRALVEAVKPVKRPVLSAAIPSDIVEDVRKIAGQRLDTLSKTVLTKEERSKQTNEVYDDTKKQLSEKYPEKEAQVSEALHDIEKQAMRETILKDGKRLDGRGLTEVRPITIELGLLPRTHGSALFTRGETQSLTTATLGTKLDEQILDGLSPETSKRFMLHYNFPPFSVGEIGRLFVGRREIGHGNLAERSLINIAPPEAEFPYTLRIVSDILESNGSSSMATVCAGSLALFDAGVPMKRAVAGIAMGLVKEGERVAVLTDILGNEDHLGDMDFKVAGTEKGITAFQMDIKIKGVSFAIMEKALAQAKDGRLHILNEMSNAIDAPRGSLSQYAPRLHTLMIPVDQIGAVIGPGGKMIRHITAESGAEISIEDDGRVVIASVDGAAAEKAIAMIEAIVEIPEIGRTYSAKVKKITEFGAFVEILPGKEGLVHISQLDVKRVEKVEDILKLGDVIDVKLIHVDGAGKMSLSRKALLPGGEGAEEEMAKSRERRSADRPRGGFGRGPRR